MTKYLGIGVTKTYKSQCNKASKYSNFSLKLIYSKFWRILTPVEWLQQLQFAAKISSVRDF